MINNQKLLKNWLSLFPKITKNGNKLDFFIAGETYKIRVEARQINSSFSKNRQFK